MSGGRILITGGSGFVGRSVAAGFASVGRALTLATRAETRQPDSSARRVQVGSIGPATRWEEALAEVETVVHLAGHVHVAPERALGEAALFDEVNHLGSLRLFEAAAAAEVRLFVFMSSITVLGAETAAGDPFTEAAPPAPGTPYAASKIAAERALAAAAARSETRLVVLRPPLVVGPGVKGNMERLIRLAASPLPLPLGRLHNRRTLVSLDNLAAAVAAVVARGGAATPGTYLLGDRAPVSTSDIVRELRTGLSRRAGLVPCPAGPVRRALELAGRGGLAQRLLGNLEVDASSFRAAFGWNEVTDTPASLRAAARAWMAERSRPSA